MVTPLILPVSYYRCLSPICTPTSTTHMLQQHLPAIFMCLFLYPALSILPNETKLTPPSRRIHTPRSMVRYRDANRHHMRLSSFSSPLAQTRFSRWLPLIAQIVTPQRNPNQVGNWHRQSQSQDLAKSLLQN
jgi:hypothetical protein